MVGLAFSISRAIILYYDETTNDGEQKLTGIGLVAVCLISSIVTVVVTVANESLTNAVTVATVVIARATDISCIQHSQSLHAASEQLNSLLMMYLYFTMSNCPKMTGNAHELLIDIVHTYIHTYI